ncbi:hypothetical protein G6O69_21460 [Pseudenhygromyxa sp. WMMC2535]|uniref:hypothetical protein n=1 Tax=Pseudenhygromyxa sp. WMMC2535 TaxID=2712867 RepID=UPI0015560CC6|nr:hypothetical protein [Pseudenhygromyxa sp. WMMC2535]NVB40422.1 hypothetical protein [Pseudenhygromyxa sp. WMMC2535]
MPRLSVDDGLFFATGEALLLLPEDPERLADRLRLDLDVDPAAFVDPNADASPTGLPEARAASSFAATASTSLEGWPFELRRAAFIAGPLEWVELDSMNGHDRWLGAGPSRFDHRWSAAETAGVRTAIDGAIGLPTLDPLVTLLISGPRAPTEPTFVVELRGRGLVVHADQNAFWDASARMNVAQALSARWLGGRVLVHEAPELDHPEARTLWFTAGTTRFIAREQLFELGLLADIDYAAEIDWVELELATNPLRNLDSAQLAAIVDSKDPRAGLVRALLTARGAIYMAWLDQRLRTRDSKWGNDGVSESLRMLVSDAVAKQRREYPLSELLHFAAFQLDYENPPEAMLDQKFQAVVGDGQRPELPADTYGPCFSPKRRKLRPFALGFIDTSEPGAERPSFTMLDPEGPAAAAGLRADDVLVELDYLPGDPKSEVRLKVERGGEVVDIDYLPEGASTRVIQWVRDPSVPVEACVR